MKSLNERLAELCGFERVGFYWKVDGQLTYKAEELDSMSLAQLDIWTPTTDLNQLRMCWEAAEKDWDTDKHMESFGSRFATVLSVILANESIYKSEFAFDVARIIAWVKQPELVAQAILKAKEVS